MPKISQETHAWGVRENPAAALSAAFLNFSVQRFPERDRAREQ